MAKYVIIIDIVGLEKRHISEALTPNISKISRGGETRNLETVFPAVTLQVQSSLLSVRILKCMELFQTDYLINKIMQFPFGSNQAASFRPIESGIL